MKNTPAYEVIIIGGSYAGLAAAMALGRSLRQVLVIDSGIPCNRQTPFSHNFLTQDGKPPHEIAAIAREEVMRYPSVTFLHDEVISAKRKPQHFCLYTSGGKKFKAKKLVIATGIRDLFPDIEGFAECHGKSVLHCPYCHGYEVRNKATGLLLHTETDFAFTGLLYNWTKQLTVFTHGNVVLSAEQRDLLRTRSIALVETPVLRLEQENGQLHQLVLRDGTHYPLRVLYAPLPFVQHSKVPEMLGCGLTEEGYLRVDHLQQTTVPGVFACGDNASRLRTVANAVATGTAAGMMLNKELSAEVFLAH